MVSEKVLDFIHRRFREDCNWLNGNCYYFAVILKERFPAGSIYYLQIPGHFVFRYRGCFYDWTGIVKDDGSAVQWEKLKTIDPALYNRIVRGCVM